jgi:ABC-type transport system substrate-binding protein
MRVRAVSIDPSAENELTPLVFDRLVSFSESGQPQPALAASWRHDSDFKRWEFRLRPGVKFHDGTPLTPELAAAALESIGAAAQGDAIVIRPQQIASKLLFTLGGLSIAKPASDGSLVGTGPFRVKTWEPNTRLILAANDDYWGGRPYLDTVEIEMSRSLRDQILDLDLNRADVVELGFADVRRLTQSGKRVWTSLPVDLLSIVFDTVDPRVREAIALSIDRNAIHDVLLQKQGVATGAIRPQWLSGYAFLFSTARDLDRARQLATGAAPVTLAYDPADPLTRLIAERVAVNAREAGLVIRPVTKGTQAAGARVSRERVASPEPPDSSYASELASLQDHRIVPLFHLPEIYGLGPRVRGWAPSRWGGWKLESVWLAP